MWPMFRINRCPHANVRGLYGDEVLAAPGFRRLLCLDCDTHLDGPVSIARKRGRQR